MGNSSFRALVIISILSGCMAPVDGAGNDKSLGDGSDETIELAFADGVSATEPLGGRLDVAVINEGTGISISYEDGEGMASRQVMIPVIEAEGQRHIDLSQLSEDDYAWIVSEIAPRAEQTVAAVDQGMVTGPAYAAATAEAGSCAAQKLNGFVDGVTGTWGVVDEPVTNLAIGSCLVGGVLFVGLVAGTAGGATPLGWTLLLGCGATAATFAGTFAGLAVLLGGTVNSYLTKCESSELPSNVG